jgi:serine/threonine protein kinase
LHGDVKAQNVMRATGGRTVLMDFGAGYDVKVDEAPGQRPAGTPLYLAPEAFSGAVRTPVSDVYSVGVLLHYLATGTYPVDGLTAVEVRRQHEIGAPRRRLRDVRPDLPDAFIRVVERATAVRPEDRHQTAGELEADLNLALRQDAPKPAPAPMPTPAPPPPPDPSPLLSRPMAFAVIGVLAALAMWLGYSRMSSPEAPSASASLPAVAPTVAVATAAPDPTTATAADDYRIEAAFYREEGGGRVRLAPGARVARGDRLSLQVASSVPTYVYVVNEDDHGESYLLFPIPDLQTTNPLSAGERHEIPGTVDGTRVHWQVSSEGGREHFLIFASPQPLSPAFQRVFDSLPRPSASSPVLARPLNSDLVGVLRGVGGLAKAPTAAAGPGLRAEFGLPLPSGEEIARGVWVRQLTLDNPRQ